MEERAYGKINLTLDILRRREDGFHDLRMVMQSVDLFDEITLNKREGEGIELSCDVGYVPSDGSNIAARAAEAFFRELGIRVPKDVAVIIYQDIQTLESKWPTGTCLEMFPDYVWENALELLFGRISQRRSQAVTVTVPTHLKIGDTA